MIKKNKFLTILEIILIVLSSINPEVEIILTIFSFINLKAQDLISEGVIFNGLMALLEQIISERGK